MSRSTLGAVQQTLHTLGGLTRWPVASQQQARRNALVASTALTRRRRELDEVEDYLERRGGLPAGHLPAGLVTDLEPLSLVRERTGREAALG